MLLYAVSRSTQQSETLLETNTPATSLRIMPRPDHIISRANISDNALKVLYRLRNAGHRACLVGGGVRDLLLGREPKDFDIATDALPEEVCQLFRNCRLIGRRFRLVHVRFGQEIIEVATFRGQNGDDEDDDDTTRRLSKNGRILSDNVYGTIEQDAWRRDFTINALYYDIADFSVVDYTGGLADLEQGLIRLIGDPEQRYREDPVRMLRAVRFAARLGFQLHSDTAAPLTKLGHLLAEIPPARLFDEMLKLFLSGCAVQTFEWLRHYRLFGYLFPATEHCLARQQQHFPKTLLVRALANTDARLSEGKSVTPAFLFAALLWEPLKAHRDRLLARGINEYEAIQAAAEEVIQQQLRRTALPRRFSLPMREIWFLQPRFPARSGKRPLRLLNHPRFRAAYDFLLLRAEAGEEPTELAEWWTHFLELDETARQEMTQPTTKPATRRRPRRRRNSAAAQPGAKQ